MVSSFFKVLVGFAAIVPVEFFPMPLLADGSEVLVFRCCLVVSGAAELTMFLARADALFCWFGLTSPCCTLFIPSHVYGSALLIASFAVVVGLRFCLAFSAAKNARADARAPQAGPPFEAAC